MKPTEDAEAVDTTDAEDAEILLADPDDYHRSQRLKEIHKARRNVHTHSSLVKESQDSSTITSLCK